MVSEWYTRDTGLVWCSPGNGVHFGVNKLGLINVYAKDIALLPEWQQAVWAGYNVGPDGSVSEELLASQMKADPANTLAPEQLLARSRTRLGEVAMARFGVRLMTDPTQLGDLLDRCHRFRSLDMKGLLELAKDLTRVVTESFDKAEMRRLLHPKKDEQLGSLKLLERLLAQDVGDAPAREVVGPLVGIYELRVADAHLVGSSLNSSLDLAGVDQTLAFVHQGRRLLESCVLTLEKIATMMETSVPGDEHAY